MRFGEFPSIVEALKTQGEADTGDDLAYGASIAATCM